MSTYLQTIMSVQHSFLQWIIWVHGKDFFFGKTFQATFYCIFISRCSIQPVQSVVWSVFTWGLPV